MRRRHRRTAVASLLMAAECDRGEQEPAEEQGGHRVLKTPCSWRGNASNWLWTEWFRSWFRNPLWWVYDRSFYVGEDRDVPALGNVNAQLLVAPLRGVILVEPLPQLACIVADYIVF